MKPRAWREAFLASGLQMAPLVEGVRQDNIENLHRTLRALAAEYIDGPAPLKQTIRAMVITARQHAAWASRAGGIEPTKREEKLEMLLWLTTWLENPPLFPAWASIRLRTRVN